MDDEDLEIVGAAPHACSSCKKNKRRCDKNIPSCGLCLKMGRFCDYSDASYADEISNLRTRIDELEDHVRHLSSQALRTSSAASPSNNQYQALNSLPRLQLYAQASYLDSDVWNYCNPPIQTSCEIVPEEIAIILGGRSDIDIIKARYFRSVHTWMPMISKIRLDRLTNHTTTAMRADVASLFLCMMLVQEAPQAGQPGPSELYIATKRFLNELQMKGFLTLRLLQAGLLLSVYELGHGIFPAAFMTTGQCARTGIALGLHNKLAPQLAGKPRSWVDWEERQRVWWMTVILDRYVTVGADHRALCTDDPTKDTLLPADDGAWNSGEMVPPDRVSLSSQQSAVSPFARLAQAANLLGRVIRHCNETALEIHFILDTFETLSQTILSLTQLLSVGGSTTSTDICAASALCFSALLKLYNHHACDLFDEDTQHLGIDIAPRFHQCMQHCLDMLKEICQRVVAFVQELRQQLTRDMIERVSPLTLHCIYSCAATLSWLSMETNDVQYKTAKLVCEDTLRSMSSRWKVASTYLEMLRISDLAEDESC